MLERLANVIYWAASATSLALLTLGVYAHFATERGHQASIFIVLISILIWLSGRAVRYVLTGR